MSNQYELPRAVGPQRRISSSEIVAALKFTSTHRLESHTYDSILALCIMVFTALL